MSQFRFALPAAALAVAIAAPSFAAAQPSAPGEPVPGTERDDVAITLVDAGDPATATTLRVPYHAGVIASYEQRWSEVGTETYHLDGGDSSSSDWEFDFEFVGTDEVLAAEEDGSALVRFSQQTLSERLDYSNPDHAPGDDFSAFPLDGVSALIAFGPSRQSTAIYEEPENPLTSEQSAYIASGPLGLGVPVPAEPVGVGAIWTWVSPVMLVGLAFDAEFTARLEALDDETFTITVEHTVDLPSADGLVLPDGVVALTAGTLSGVRTTEGRVSEPLDHRHTEEVTYSLALELADGVTYEASAVSTATYSSAVMPATTDA